MSGGAEWYYEREEERNKHRSKYRKVYTVQKYEVITVSTDCDKGYIEVGQYETKEEAVKKVERLIKQEMSYLRYKLKKLKEVK